MADVINFAVNPEQELIDQIDKFANSVTYKDCKIRVMADGHAGKGCAVGSVIEYKDKISPFTVGVDIACVDKDTEILTPQGWIKISSYSGQKILVYDIHSDMSFFETPVFIKAKCDSFWDISSSNGLDMRLSDEHTTMYWKGYSKNPKDREIVYMPAKEFCKKHNSLKKGVAGGVKTTFHLRDSGLGFSEARIRYLVALSADGYIYPKNKQCSPDTGHKYAEFHFSKERKILRCRQILKSAGVPYKERINRSNNTVTFFCQIPLEDTKDLSIFWRASEKELKIVADECLYWDGHRALNEKTRDYYSSTVKSNIDIIQYAFAVSSVRAGIYKKRRQKTKRILGQFILLRINL